MSPSSKRGGGLAGARPTLSLAEVGIGAAWVVGIGGGVHIVGAMLGQNPMASAVVAAVVVEIAATRAGVRWDERQPVERGGAKEEAPEGGFRRGLRQVGAGLGVGVAVVAVAVVALVVFGQATVAFGRPGSSVLFACARAAGVAVRDELWLRGVPRLFAARAGAPAWTGIVFGAAGSAAVIALSPDVTPAAIALAATSGWLYAELWSISRSAYVPIAAHAAIAFLVGPGLRGGLLDATFASGALSDGVKAWGSPAWALAALCALAAAVIRARARAAKSLA